MSLQQAFSHLSDELPEDEEIVGWLLSHFGPTATLSVFGGNDSGQINDDELPALMVGEAPANYEPSAICSLETTAELTLRVVWKMDDQGAGFTALLALYDILPRAIMRNRTMGDSVQDAVIRTVQRETSEQPTYIVRADLRLTYDLRIDGG